MSFKNMKRDDHGHVISNDEIDGQKCQHVNGGAPSAQAVEDQKYNKEMKAAQEQNADMSESFDDDYDEEFKEYDDMLEDEENIKNDILDKIQNCESSEEAEDIYYEIDDYEERGDISDKTADELRSKLDSMSEFDEEDDEDHNNNTLGDNRDPNNPKYKDFKSSDITNAELVDEGEEIDDFDKGQKRKLSIIKYIPYGALKDGDKRELYGVVNNYDGSDTFKGGAIVSPSLESAKEDLKHQIQLGIQGSDRYLKRGKYDEDYFNIIRDNREPGDDEKYKERYGWDFNKPFAEHDFMKDDPYLKYQQSKQKPAPKPYNGKLRYKIGYGGMYYPVKEDGTYLGKDIKFPDLKSLQDVYGKDIKEDTVDHWLTKHSHH